MMLSDMNVEMETISAIPETVHMNLKQVTVCDQVQQTGKVYYMKL